MGEAGAGRLPGRRIMFRRLQFWQAAISVAPHETLARFPRAVALDPGCGLIASLIITAVLGLIFSYINSVMRFVLFDSVLAKGAKSASAGAAGTAGVALFRLADLYDLLSMVVVMIVGIPPAFAFGMDGDLKQKIT